MELQNGDWFPKVRGGRLVLEVRPWCGNHLVVQDPRLRPRDLNHDSFGKRHGAEKKQFHALQAGRWKYSGVGGGVLLEQEGGDDTTTAVGGKYVMAPRLYSTLSSPRIEHPRLACSVSVYFHQDTITSLISFIPFPRRSLPK